MNHAVVTEHLADYLEGDLALDLRALVDAHLDSCELCASEVREMQQTIRLLRALPEPEHPPMIAANVMRRIRAGEAEPTFFERIQRTLAAVLEPSFVLPASAIAVAALVIMVVQGGNSSNPALWLSGERTAAEADPVAAPTGAADPASSLQARPAVEVAEVAGGETVERAFGASVARDLAAATDGSTGGAGPTSSVAMEMALAAAAAAANRPSTDGFAERDSTGEDAWGDPRSNAALAAREDGGRSYLVDPALAQGLASDVSGPGASAPTNRIVEGMGGAVPLSLSRRVRTDGSALGGVPDSSGEDPRDVWIGRALEHPADFAHYIAQHSLAEQELWVERLSERAEARGLLGELVAALRGAGDEKATWLADDFAAQTEASGSDGTSAGTPAPSVHAP